MHKNIFHRDWRMFSFSWSLVKQESASSTLAVAASPQRHLSIPSVEYLKCTTIYTPPEWLNYRTYQARPTTVWQLGALFYSLLPGHERFTTMDFINRKIHISRELPKDCRTLLYMCLNSDPMDRVTLEDHQQYIALR
ncbi:serine/threonine-protein kinase pim-2-like [Notolabrus celidotus]|uniref:serine/threonine-protein kinase pim-2-like n=1 Tax=Notolabrus celidotus TaxID=1203425 RepID=UPI0014905198|nr:serine/threonine-protein kinase pim-2-like [Notolabrus celidotus]